MGTVGQAFGQLASCEWNIRVLQHLRCHRNILHYWWDLVYGRNLVVTLICRNKRLIYRLLRGLRWLLLNYRLLLLKLFCKDLYLVLCKLSFELKYSLPLLFVLSFELLWCFRGCLLWYLECFNTAFFGFTLLICAFVNTWSRACGIERKARQSRQAFRLFNLY